MVSSEDGRSSTENGQPPARMDGQQGGRMVNRVGSIVTDASQQSGLEV